MSRAISPTEQKKVAERIIELRKQSRLSKNAFAMRCGYSPALLSNVEKCERLPSEDLLNRICQSYGVTEEWLLGKVDTEPQFPEETPGARVRKLRTERKLSIPDFAQSIQSAQSAVYAVENGERELTLRYAKRIEVVYHISSDWLLLGDERCINYPCDENMLQYLSSHEELRQEIWELMQKENGEQD